MTARRSGAGAASTAVAPMALATPDHPVPLISFSGAMPRHQINLLEALPHGRVEQKAFGVTHRHDHALGIERIGEKPLFDTKRRVRVGGAQRHDPRETGVYRHAASIAMRGPKDRVLTRPV